MQMHAGCVMLATAKPEMGRCSPGDVVRPGDSTPCSTHRVHIQVSDLDAAYKRAKEAGATTSKEPYNTLRTRSFELTDPEGGKW